MSQCILFPLPENARIAPLKDVPVPFGFPAVLSQVVPFMSMSPRCPCLALQWYACSSSVLAEVLPGPPVLLDAYEAAVELGQELELAPGPLSALLHIVRCAITMCTRECRAGGWRGAQNCEGLIHH